MRAMGMVIALLLLPLPALAQEEPAQPDTPEQAAEKVLAAFKAQDEEALKTLSAQDDPDPWLVANELCFRGGNVAALAFAEAAPRKDTERLAEYVQSHDQEGEPRLREALAVVNSQLREGKPAAALETLEKVDGGKGGVVSVRLAYARGLALSRLARWGESRAAFREAGKAAQEIGWLSRAAQALLAGGNCSYNESDFGGAITCWELLLSLEEARSNPAGVAAALANLGNAHGVLAEYAQALECHERSLKIDEQLGNRAGVASTLGNIGIIHDYLGEYGQALHYYERSLEMKKEIGDRVGVAQTLLNIGAVSDLLSDYAKALEHLEQSLALAEELGDRATVAAAHQSLGVTHDYLGERTKALEHYERALPLLREIGNRRGMAGVLTNIGIIHRGFGAYSKSLAHHEQAREILEQIGDRVGVAQVLQNMGSVYQSVGDYPEALRFMEDSLAILEELGDRVGVAGALRNMGNALFRLGEYADALEHYERSLRLCDELGNRSGVAYCLGLIGVVHHHLGDYARALKGLESSLRLHEELGDRAGIAVAVGNLASLYGALGDKRKELEAAERALKLSRDLLDKTEEARHLGNTGLILRNLGRHEEALERCEQSLELAGKLGSRLGIAAALGIVGDIHFARGDYQKALKYQERSLDLFRELDAADFVIHRLWGIALTQLALGAPREALAAARSAVSGLGGLSGGLAAEHGAGFREHFSRLFDAGLRAASLLEDPQEVSHFLESGRALVLLEELGGRERLQSSLVPEDLQTALARAREAECEAVRLHGSSLGGEDEDEIRARRQALDKAREAVRETIHRIQRQAKDAADVLYPEPDPLPEICSRLGNGEALVVYALMEGEALALVVTRMEQRIVSLPDSATIERTCGRLFLAGAERTRGLDLGGSAGDASVGPLAAEELADLVVEPLGLDAKVRRVLVSPHGALGGVPFALLLGDREVAYVPSGTTYGVLLEDRRDSGEMVLALGDPDYGVERDATAMLVHRGGKLTPLPATKEEAKAVADVLLLGKEATEAGLAEAVGKRERWRAVHLACHGLIDTERPTLSSLAITPDPENDGFLTCLEVFRMKIPADLVVLSACETARGKVYRAEGIVGLTRAFMMAGAPRVICSLWKVDDEATKALMVKFYELWNPKEGEGLPTATALKKAQEFVRSHEKWKHPYYWAAWVLWGLPE